MKNIIILPLLIFFCSGCTTLADQHKRRIAEVNLVQAEANFLNRCSYPKLEGLPACVYPGTWPYASSNRVGDVPATSIKVLPNPLSIFTDGIGE